jgi:hypothetical protein
MDWSTKLLIVTSQLGDMSIGLARNGLNASKVLSNLITLLGTLKIPSP